MRGRPGNRAFTSIEIVVVVAVIIVMTGILVPMMAHGVFSAKKGQAETEIASVYTAIIKLFSDTNAWPARPCYAGGNPDNNGRAMNQQRYGFFLGPWRYGSGWKGPYLQQAIGLDPWGRDFQYDSEQNSGPGQASYGSYGPDGRCSCFMNNRTMVLPADDVAVYLNMRCFDNQWSPVLPR